MVDSNVEGSSAPPVRIDDEILPFNKWVSIGKSNCYLKADKPHNHSIFQIALDVLKHTTFFRAFTASATIQSIYIQQFWNTITTTRLLTGTCVNLMNTGWTSIKRLLAMHFKLCRLVIMLSSPPCLIQLPYWALLMNWDIPLMHLHYPPSSLMICTNRGELSRVSLTCA